MKISIITAALNNKRTIEECILSILNQSQKDIEHIVIDGGSSDGTLEVIRKYDRNIAKWISEPDKGIYDALNKGIKIASGDIVGFLHADDVYADGLVLRKVVFHMQEKNVDSCYGDLLYVSSKNTDRVVRYWRSCPYNDTLFNQGWMPPHPTFFVKRDIYTKFGSFNTQFRIAADYELMLRFLVRHRISTTYIPEVLIKMRVGGTSNKNLKNMIIKSGEDYRAWKINGLDRKFYTIPLKNLCKIPQFIRKQGAL